MRALQPIGSASSQPFCPRLPGSKSATARALVIAALQRGECELRGALHADDTRALARALDAFHGLVVKETDAGFRVARSAEHLAAPDSTLDLGAAGTPARFLLAFATTAIGSTVVTGSTRLQERPMGGLVDALRSLGIACEPLGREGCLPMRVHGGPLRSRDARVRADGSSQFASALLLRLSADDCPARIVLEGDAVSRPYTELTRRMLRDAGAPWRWQSEQELVREAGALRQRSFDIEPDASSAGYFFALAAATRSTVAVHGIRSDSTQADLALLDALAAMGCRVDRGEARIAVHGAPLRGIDVDLADAPDCSLTIAALATLADGPTRIRGTRSLRDKESDRAMAACQEVAKLGATASYGDDWIEITPGPCPSAATISTYDDHRVAMAFSVVGAVRDGVAIENPDCVAKSFPTYWDEYDRFLAHHRGDRGATFGTKA